MFSKVKSAFLLTAFVFGAENETRTRDPNLGKVVLYQLSYFRISCLGLQRYEDFFILQIYFEKICIFFAKLCKKGC